MAVNTNAQETLYSQYFANPIYVNPAMIGSNPGLRANIHHRDQWQKLPQDIKFYNFNMDLAERNIPGSGGLGLVVNRDYLWTGVVQTTNIGLGTSVRIRISENFVAQLGVMGLIRQREINDEGLVFSDMLNDKTGGLDNVGAENQTQYMAPDYDNISYPDLKLGGTLRYYGQTYNGDRLVGTLGLAVDHVFMPEESWIGSTQSMFKLPRKYTAHFDLLYDNEANSSSYKRNKHSHMKVNPGMIWENQNPFTTFAVGANVMRSNLYLGMWYRGSSYESYTADSDLHMNDLIFLIGLHTKLDDVSRLKVMYSYDWSLNDNLKGQIGATHEISLSIEFGDLFLFGNKNRIVGTGFKSRSAGELECSPF